jgi:hypothetical protein
MPNIYLVNVKKSMAILCTVLVYSPVIVLLHIFELETSVMLLFLQPGNDPYAFVEFTDHQGAAAALAAMNKRLFLDKVGCCNSTSLMHGYCRRITYGQSILVVAEFVWVRTVFCLRLFSIQCRHFT